MVDRPTYPFALSLAGGMITAGIGSAFAEGFGSSFGTFDSEIFIVLTLACSAMIVLGAFLQYSGTPSLVRRGSLLVLIATLVAIPFTLFGVVAGGVLCVMGAVKGFRWNANSPAQMASAITIPKTAAKDTLSEPVEPDRSLSAIMFTDIVGYSSISHTDEDEALRIVESQRKIARPLLAKYGGREVKTIGDALLVEFPSAVEAVRCAIEVQKAIHDFDLIQPRRFKILLRIGIHVGDVVHSERDVYGDAVNVANRIEALAPPGGICISRQVFENVRSQVDLRFDSIGLQRLRNIADDYEVFNAVLPWKDTVGN